MTQITLELPEELSARLAPWRTQLPQILTEMLELYANRLPLATSSAESANPAFQEMIDFLADGPRPEQIAAFKVSEMTQARVNELLDKQRETSLTAAELAELDVYEQVHHIMVLLKARARQAFKPV